MKTLIIILVMAALLQTTIIPVDLVLLILLCRAYLKSGRENLYLAFAFGLLVAHLDLTNLGLRVLLYLIYVQITQVLSRWSFSGNPLLIVPITGLVLLINQITHFYLNHQSIEPANIIFSSLLILPLFYLLKLWEERFVVRKEIKLKL